MDIKRHYMERRPFLQRVYLTLADVSPYADVAADLGFRVVNDIAVILDGETFSSLELDMGPRSVDGWLTRVTIEEVKSGEWGIGGQALTTDAVKALAAGKAAAA